jgi:hypothetical protein
MPLPLIPLLISAGVSAGKAIHQGVQARKEKKKLESLERPQYQVSPMLQENLEQAKIQAQTGLPAEVMQRGQQQSDRMMAAQLAAPGMAGAGVGGVAGAVQGSWDQFSQMITQDAMAREQNKQNLYQARQAMAGEQARAFQINQLDPYQQQLASGQAMLGAAKQGMFAGIDELGSTAITAAGMMNGGGQQDTGGTEPYVG